MSSKSYDQPLRISYGLGLVDFGTGSDEATAIAKPPGVSRCRIESISVLATEVFAGSTSTARIEIGTAADPNRFADADLGTTADTDGFEAAADDYFDVGYGGKGVVDLSSSGENISQLEVGLISGVGTPTGQGYTTITVAWW